VVDEPMGDGAGPDDRGPGQTVGDGQGAAPSGVGDDGVPGPSLADGTYDALVVDAGARDDGTVSIDLTVIAGPAKGEVVTIVACGMPGDPLDLLGVPATLTVADGAPSLQLEP
jgi:hypothetical protein